MVLGNEAIAVSGRHTVGGTRAPHPFPTADWRGGTAMREQGGLDAYDAGAVGGRQETVNAAVAGQSVLPPARSFPPNSQSRHHSQVIPKLFRINCRDHVTS